MPISECGLLLPDGRPDPSRLVTLGPSTMVTVGFADSQVPGCENEDLVPALIDTGAAESCIDVDLARRLGLPKVDEIVIAGIGGQSRVPVYIARLVFIHLGFVQTGLFSGVHLAAGGQVHRVLLGRTALASMLMIYDGIRGHVTICTQ